MPHSKKSMHLHFHGCHDETSAFLNTSTTLVCGGGRMSWGIKPIKTHHPGLSLPESYSSSALAGHAAPLSSHVSSQQRFYDGKARQLWKRQYHPWRRYLIPPWWVSVATVTHRPCDSNLIFLLSNCSKYVSVHICSRATGPDCRRAQAQPLLA